MHGLYLKRHGSDVVILEQEPKNIRSSHNAGIGFGPLVQEFLRRYDHTNIQNCTPSQLTRLAYRKRLNFLELNIQRHASSWGLLYRILRSNFDGLPSEPIPEPPKALEGDGTAEYRAGSRVTKLDYQDGRVTVGYVDGIGNEHSITADFVIGADGLHSTIRSLVQAPTIKEYSGYVSWRGVVPESNLSEDTVKYFERTNCLNLLKHNYIVWLASTPVLSMCFSADASSYMIPPDHGSFAPGERLINFVWYWNYAQESQALKEVMTDINLTVHSNTVPSGLVRPEVWDRHLATNLDAVAAPFAEVISMCKKPFVTKVNDALTDKAIFFDGHLVLVGDALATYRPHLALATEQVAGHCLDLGKVWHGEMTLQQWERKACVQAKRIWLASRAAGVFGLGSWLPFLSSLLTYLAFSLKLKLGKV
jgi:2-polyprenyl-6-methoxyphenol hydroxylase-like FAD-dependent oxidoreductase